MSADGSSAASSAVLAGLPSLEQIAQLPPNGGAEFNRLIFETSPYLLQHARRPIDWYPWGREAFEKAANEDKPIFLSLGYATCHWCHVMEAESFLNEDVARALDSGFVAIKVDREERPDVDHLYMTATQALTGSGGWPNTLLLTPDRKPFFAGTYIPRTQLLELLQRAQNLWRTERAALTTNADEIAAGLTSHLSRSASGPFTQQALRRAADALVSNFDPIYGGFGSAPKFPTPQRLSYLLRAWKRFGIDEYLETAVRTLQAIREGGIYDQVGLGIHRYSTDRTWTVPHFEKMLYDQALAVLAYLEAFEATQKSYFRIVAEEILTYVSRDLGDSKGAFFSAEDADSEGIEGKCYVWRETELVDVLGDELGEKAKQFFETTLGGNFHEPGLDVGANVLRLSKSVSPDHGALVEIRKCLLEARRTRIPPLKDDKILCDWTGLMIAAFARAGAVLNEPKWISRARVAADFVLQTMRSDDGSLRHTNRLGQTKGEPGAQDYAFMIWGLVELIQATGDPEYMTVACELADILISEYWDPDSGGFYMSRASATDLFTRAKELEEGAIPSGNGAAALALSGLSKLTAEPRFAEYANATLESFGKDLSRSPEAFMTAMLTLDARDGATVVLAGSPDEPVFRAALQRLRGAYAPGVAILPLDSSRSAEFPPFLAGFVSQAGLPTAYVCRGAVCDLPTTNIEAALQALAR